MGAQERKVDRVVDNLRELFAQELELEFVLRPTVSRPVSLGIGPHFWTLDQILSCSSFV
jgi:hypothetical protein